MAREVTKIELLGSNRDGEPRRYLVASDASITKGTILKFADARTASTSAGTNDIFAGVASMDKKNDDYSTSISAFTNAILEFTASGAISAGDTVATAAPGNYVMTLVDNASSHAIVIGYALDSVGSGSRAAIRMNI